MIKDIPMDGVGCIYFKCNIIKILEAIKSGEYDTITITGLKGTVDDETKRVCNLFLGILAFEDGNAKVTIQNENN